MTDRRRGVGGRPTPQPCSGSERCRQRCAQVAHRCFVHHRAAAAAQRHLPSGYRLHHRGVRAARLWAVVGGAHDDHVDRHPDEPRAALVFHSGCRPASGDGTPGVRRTAGSSNVPGGRRRPGLIARLPAAGLSHRDPALHGDSGHRSGLHRSRGSRFGSALGHRAAAFAGHHQLHSRFAADRGLGRGDVVG